MCNTYCFSTATVVAWMCLNVMLFGTSLPVLLPLVLGLLCHLQAKVLNMKWKVYEYDVLLSVLVFCSPPPPEALVWCDDFLSWMVDCVVAWCLLFCSLFSRCWGVVLAAPSYLALRLKKVYSYTSAPSLCLHGRLQGELCLSHGISLDTISSFQFLSWHWATDSSDCMIVAVCFASVMTVIIFFGFRLLMCRFVLGLDSVLYFFGILDARTQCINIITEYFRSLGRDFEDHVFGTGWAKSRYTVYS